MEAVRSSQGGSGAPGRRTNGAVAVPVPFDGDRLPGSLASSPGGRGDEEGGSSGPLSPAICAGPARWMCTVGAGHLCQEEN